MHSGDVNHLLKCKIVAGESIGWDSDEDIKYEYESAGFEHPGNAEDESQERNGGGGGNEPNDSC